MFLYDINSIQRNNEKIQYIVKKLCSADEIMQKIAENMKTIMGTNYTDKNKLIEALKENLRYASRVQDNLIDAKKSIGRVDFSEEKTKLKNQLKSLQTQSNNAIEKLNNALSSAHISMLYASKSSNELLADFFGSSRKHDRQIAASRAKEAEQRAIEATEKAKKAAAEEKIAEARRKEAEALKTAKMLEAGMLEKRSEKENLELLNSIREKELQIVTNANEAIETAKEALLEASNAGDLNKVKESADLIKEKAMEVENVSVVKGATAFQKTHEIYNSILKDIKQNISPMLVGPAGSGKSTVLQQIANTLNLNYYPLSVNGQTSEYQIIGYRNANGEYIRTAFRDAFENGGLFSFEEIDAGNPNVLTVMNNALSQDFYLFPDRCVKKHDDFRLAASANTFGRGANRQYIGRNPLDAATLDRFAMSYVDYDEELERKIGPEPMWTDYIQTIRQVVESFSMPIVVSTRAVVFGGRDVKSGTSWDTALEKFVWRGCSKSDVEKILQKANELKRQYTKLPKQK